jgi:LmbE family N-acetylglucosaminyl deacetylase
VIDLEPMFSPDDWLELYANVDIIDQHRSVEERYQSNWSSWAEEQGNQTAEQWRQYYEKIVRPSWQSDPIWKREQITKKVEKRRDAVSSSQAQTSSETQHLEPDKPEKDTETPADTFLEGETVVEEPPVPEEEPPEDPAKDDRNVRVPPAYTLYARERKWDTLNAQPGLDYSKFHPKAHAYFH